MTEPSEKNAKPKRPSGQHYRVAKREREKKERADHRARLRDSGVLCGNVEPCKRVDRAHFWQLQRLLDLQMEIEKDEVMTLDDKIRHTCSVSQAMSKINLQADIEREVDELKGDLDAKIRELHEAKQQLQLDRKMERETVSVAARPSSP